MEWILLKACKQYSELLGTKVGRVVRVREANWALDRRREYIFLVGAHPGQEPWRGAYRKGRSVRADQRRNGSEGDELETLVRLKETRKAKRGNGDESMDHGPCGNSVM